MPPYYLTGLILLALAGVVLFLADRALHKWDLEPNTFPGVLLLIGVVVAALSGLAGIGYLGGSLAGTEIHLDYLTPR